MAPRTPPGGQTWERCGAAAWVLPFRDSVEEASSELSKGKARPLSAF